MHPDFESLSRYALCESSPAEAAEVERHLAQCPTCRKEANELSLLDLGQRYAAESTAEPRGPCPSPERWSAFVEGSLPAAGDAELETHLLSCDDCVFRALAIRRFRNLEVPEHVLAQVRRLGKSIAPSRQPRPLSWLALPVSFPRWAALSFATVALALGVLVFRGSLSPTSPPEMAQSTSNKPQVSPDQQKQLWAGLNALEPGDERLTLVRVTPVLESSFTAYEKLPTAEQRSSLLEQLQKLEPALPAQRIHSVQLQGTPSGKPGSWIVLRWNESQLDVVSITNPEVPPAHQ